MRAMLCRRCGMESSTTDVCEWCKRPMLPAGATISQKAAQEVKGDYSTPPGEPSEDRLEASAALAEETEMASEEEEAPALSQEEEVPAQEEEAPAVSEQEEAPPAPEEEEAEHQLRPLGGVQPSASSTAPGAPSHGLSDEAMQTSIDISQYLGDDQSIFRPQKSPEPSSAMPGSADPLARRRVSTEKSEPGSELSENARLGRCVIAGLVVGVAAALIQYFVTGETLLILYFLRLGRGANLMTALKYGIATGVILGIGLGAILIKLRKGSFLGMLIGLLVGMGFQNPPWGLMAGALTGIVAGRFATVGLRQRIAV